MLKIDLLNVLSHIFADKRLVLFSRVLFFTSFVYFRFDVGMVSQQYLDGSTAFNFDCKNGDCNVCKTTEGAVQVVESIDKPFLQFVCP